MPMITKIIMIDNYNALNSNKNNDTSPNIETTIVIMMITKKNKFVYFTL